MSMNNIVRSIVSKTVKLSHKQFRAMLKKFRRKKKRQQLAKEREQQELLEQQRKENSPNYKAREEERIRNTKLYEEFEERERIRKHKLWLLREEQAQVDFKKKQEELEYEKARREEERKQILAEFEKQLLVEKEVTEKNEKIKSQKEEALQEALSKLPEDGPWHNPIAPSNYSVAQEAARCEFFAKTGCCRFGERCSRGHSYPSVSTTLLIKGLYSHFSIDQSGRDDYDTDIGLEYEEKERYQHFLSFYWDVFPEFKKFGKVVQFKVCSNYEPHLRGNVYVQYSREEEALEACKSFNGRYYAGKLITCEFTHVIKWKSAICGLHDRNLCPKGICCNFLHVFQNPTNEFWAADRDLPPKLSSRDSHSSRRHEDWRRSDRTQYYGYSDYYRHYRDSSPDSYRSRYSRSSSYHHRRSSDRDFEGESYRNSSRTKYDKNELKNSERNGDYAESHHKKRTRNSRSRSPSPKYSSDENVELSTHKKKKKHKKKKSKKEKKRKISSSDES